MQTRLPWHSGTVKMRKLERLFLKFMLRWREKQIGKDFNRQLSGEIDCLQILIDGRKNEN